MRPVRSVPSRLRRRSGGVRCRPMRMRAGHQQVIDDARLAFVRAEPREDRRERQELELEGKPVPSTYN